MACPRLEQQTAMLVLFKMRLDLTESVKGEFPGLFRKSRELVHSDSAPLNSASDLFGQWNWKGDRGATLASGDSASSPRNSVVATARRPRVESPGCAPRRRIPGIGSTRRS